MPVIASDEVGAADGGLVRDGPGKRPGRARGRQRGTGAAIRRWPTIGRLRGGLRNAGAQGVSGYSHDAGRRAFAEP